MENEKTSMNTSGRFRPRIVETSKIRATRFNDLCKSCGECIVKCPVNAISWNEKELGQLGEPSIYIDLNKCIGCEICERSCPDSAIEITNKRLESERFSTGILGALVRSNALFLEWAVILLRPKAERLKKVGKSEEKTFWCKLLRFGLRYGDEKPKKVDVVD